MVYGRLVDKPFGQQTCGRQDVWATDTLCDKTFGTFCLKARQFYYLAFEFWFNTIKLLCAYIQLFNIYYYGKFYVDQLVIIWDMTQNKRGCFCEHIVHLNVCNSVPSSLQIVLLLFDLCMQNVLIKEADGRTVAVVADFGLATKIPDPLYVHLYVYLYVWRVLI